MCKNTSLFVDLYTSLELSHQVRLRIKHTIGKSRCRNRNKTFPKLLWFTCANLLWFTCDRRAERGNLGRNEETTLRSPGCRQRRRNHEAIPTHGIQHEKMAPDVVHVLFVQRRGFTGVWTTQNHCQDIKIWSDAAPKLKFTKGPFTWYQNEMSYQNENFVRIENRNELIPELLVRDLTFVSVSCKQIQRNIWGWNELVLEWKSFRYHVNGP